MRVTFHETPIKPSREDIIDQARKLHLVLLQTDDPAVAISLIARGLARAHMLSLSYHAEMMGDLLLRQVTKEDFAKYLREENEALTKEFNPWEMV
jgi:galactose-1-phosphate uridylyltransferase